MASVATQAFNLDTRNDLRSFWATTSSRSSSCSAADGVGTENTSRHESASTTPPSELASVSSPSWSVPYIQSSANKLSELYAGNIVAKILRTSLTAAHALPDAFPEIIPQEPGSDGEYSLRPAEFWTCGFFPGSMHTILERCIRFPGSVNVSQDVNSLQLIGQLRHLCADWIDPIRRMDGRTDTHDIGFIMMPALRLDWELFGNRKTLDSIVRAARSLATRYVPSAKAIRSWDILKKRDFEILDQKDNMVVIIDSLCNLDLLYYAAQFAQDLSLAEIATAHAETLLRTHLRPETGCSASENAAYRGQWYSTCHVANIHPETGDLKFRMTAQGYSDDSTWSRGQAWGILGYAETYVWTKDRRFLDAACGLAEYFLHRLKTAPKCVIHGRNVPLWDFDAPIEDEHKPLRDSSAGVIAANGMLLLSQALAGTGESRLSSHFLDAALDIVQDTLDFALAPEKACLRSDADGKVEAEDVSSGSRFDGILKFGTANNNRNAKRRYANHGLVYGDYYLILFGNRLLRMGMQ